MSKLFKGKYRTTSTRWKNWDYGSAAAYFITISTKDRLPFFGEIQGGNMQLNEVGRIVESEWVRTPLVRPDMHLELGSYVVMPNHFHAIILIGVNEYNSGLDSSNSCGGGARHRASTGGLDSASTGGLYSASTGGLFHASTEGLHFPNLGSGGSMLRDSTGGKGNTPNQFGPQSKNLASIFRGFKSSVTMQARHFLPDFAWQSLFHDTVIRNERSFQRISEYIIRNPQKWKEDRFSGSE